MATGREDALRRAAAAFDSGAFERRLAELVAIPSTSQEPERAPELERYLREAMEPWLRRMGFSTEVHPNEVVGAGPILIAERVEDPALPSVITYGHGDTVRGMEGEWSRERTPWTLRREGDRWYGRGSADNKGQHAINLFALEQVLAARSNRLGANVRLVLEMGEERGSPGLRSFVARHAARLASDVFIASDGPRVAPATPTLAAGSRGNYHFDLVVQARGGEVHSGHWGGLTTDPALVLSHALAAIADRHGRVLVRDWLPGGGAPLSGTVRALLADCPVDPGTDAAEIEPGWGEPGLSAAEKLYAWNSVIVLSQLSGRPEAPVNAVAPWARAHCQIRYTPETDPAVFVPALRRHLDVAGFPEVRIENARQGMPGSATPLGDSWLLWAADSLRRSLDGRMQLIPATSGGMPGDVFKDLLGTPLIWVPHGHNGCQQHGPDEHLLMTVAREGVIAFAGLWWDLAQLPLPPRPIQA
jgi:acetylornithine deacetylase/succinyl-diaminopimelate desuccinylase-like protein